MIRTKRIYYNKAVYHVTFRGNNRQVILKSADDKEVFLGILSKFKEKFGFKLYGFCLMDNHVHLLIESTPIHNISRIMQSILLSYSFRFRTKYKYIGHVWQGRFTSNIIDKEEYLLACLDYIHENPVKAKIAERVDRYPWSSYCFYHEPSNEFIAQFITMDRYRYRDTSVITP